MKSILFAEPSSIENMEDVLRKLENSSFSQRQREMIEFGRIAGTPAGSHLLSILCCMAFSQDPYPRLTCIAGFRSYINNIRPVELSSEVLKAVNHLLYDCSRPVYTRAARIAGKLFQSFDALRFTTELPLPYVKVFCKSLLTEGKKNVLDACFKQDEVVNNVKRRDAVASYVSDELIMSLPREIFLSFSRGTYKKLVIRSPFVMLQKVNSLLLSDTKTPDFRSELHIEMFSVVYMVVYTLAKTGFPSREGLELFLLTFHHLNISENERKSCLFLYMALYTEELSRYILQFPKIWKKGTVVSTRLRKRLYKLPIEILKPLVIDHEIIPLRYFAEFPVDLCDIVYSSTLNRLKEELPSFFLYLRSPTARQTEGKKIFDDGTNNPETRVSGLSAFPFSVICDLCGKNYLNHSEVEVRIAVMKALVKSVNYYPEALTQCLAFCVRHQNERDAFQFAMFMELASLRICIWKEDHLSFIDVLIKSLVAAKDLSLSTAQEAAHLLLNVAWNYPDFTAFQLPILMQREPYAPPKRKWIPLESAKKVWNSIFPILEERLKTKERCYLFDLNLDMFAKPIMKKISDSLEGFILHCLKCKNVVINLKMCPLDVKWTSPKVISMIPTLLKACPKSAQCTGVSNSVAYLMGGKSLVELLKPIDGDVSENEKNEPSNHAGKYSKKYIQFSSSTRFYCWTSQQQKIYASTILQVIQTKPPPKEAWRLFQILSHLPSLSLEEGGIKRMTCSDFDPPYYHSLAMDLLGHMTDLASLNVLCTAIKEVGPDSRAKEAIYPLSKRLKLLPFSSAFSYLSLALHGKGIRIEREIVRLMGSFGCDPAFAALRKHEKERETNLHRDVKVALLESYYNFLWKCEVWEDYDEIVARNQSTQDTSLLSPIIGIPEEFITMRWQRERFNDFLLRLLSHSDRSVVLSVLHRLCCSQKQDDPRWYPVIFQIIENAQKDRMLCSAACRAIIALRIDATSLAESISVFSSDEALKAFIMYLSTSSSNKNSLDETKEVQVAYLLAKKLLDSGTRFCLAARCFMMCSPRTWVELLQKMYDAHQLHSGVQFLVLNIITKDNFSSSKNFVDELSYIEESFLRYHKEPFFRRMGLACLSLSIVERMYKSKFVDALKVYRADETPWVKEDALSTAFPDDC